LNEKSTVELNQILNSVSRSELDNYYQQNNISSISLSDYLLEYLAKHDLCQADVINACQVPRSYCYAIFNGNKRNPSRDRLIAIGISMKMSRDDLDRLLKIANLGILYPREPRDAAIITCLNDGVYNIIDINLFLNEKGFSPLKTSAD